MSLRVHPAFPALPEGDQEAPTALPAPGGCTEEAQKDLSMRDDEDGAGDSGGHGSSSTHQPPAWFQVPSGLSLVGSGALKVSPGVIPEPCQGSGSAALSHTLPWAPLRQLGYLQLRVKAD